METRSAEVCTNIIICLIHQTNYLLDQQLKALEAYFLEEGGFTGRLYHSRRRHGAIEELEKKEWAV